MPKVSLSALPISALFAVNKPSGPTSMSVVNDIKTLACASRLFVDGKVAARNLASLKEGKKAGKKQRGKEAELKIGQGGTLDPLADGVLVIGVGRGTKKLTEFLDCVKEYHTTCLLGAETDSYDAQGTIVRTTPYSHVTPSTISSLLPRFRGAIQQTPPVFSALKMDGRPLYDYARTGTPLPRPIERRAVTVSALEVEEWFAGGEHKFVFPEKRFTDEERAKMEKALRGVELPADAVIKDEPEPSASVPSTSSDQAPKADPSEGDAPTAPAPPPAFTLRMRVSGGTYVRSLAHDLGHAAGSSAHVVTLTRARQGRFVLDPQKSAALSQSAVSGASSSTSALGNHAGVKQEEEGAPAPEGTAAESATAPADVKAVASEPALDTLPPPAAGEGAVVDAAVADGAEKLLGCVPWSVFARALADPGGVGDDAPDEEGWRAWERAVIECMEVVDAK